MVRSQSGNFEYQYQDSGPSSTQLECAETFGPLSDYLSDYLLYQSETRLLLSRGEAKDVRGRHNRVEFCLLIFTSRGVAHVLATRGGKESVPPEFSFNLVQPGSYRILFLINLQQLSYTQISSLLDLTL